jgi:RHS repeat-associated protein
MVTDGNHVVVARHDYTPFGEEIPAEYAERGTEWGGYDAVNQKFTGKERDSETGLDYFGARYMSSAQGRFTSPDLLNLTEARLVNPANTLNKYIYGGNNPLKYVDPDGLDITLFYQPVQSTLDPNDWGHVFIGAYNQQSSEVQFLDFYPDGQLNGLSGPGTFNGGAFSEREGRFASITVQTTPEITQQVIDFIKDIKAHPQRYVFPFKTCTTVCNTALKLVGMGSPATLTPQGLWNTWLNRYTSQRSQSFDGKSFLPPPPQVSPGVDYGNPRTNALDWQRSLFDLWRNQPKQACVEAAGEKTCDAF